MILNLKTVVLLFSFQKGPPFKFRLKSNPDKSLQVIVFIYRLIAEHQQLSNSKLKAAETGKSGDRQQQRGRQNE